MSHELEIVNGKASMAYAGETPWHGLGKEVPNDLTPMQMLKAANLDWTVEKVPAFIQLPHLEPMKRLGEMRPHLNKVSIPRCALVRSSDQKILDVVTPDWNPLQNEEAFDFFKDFVMKGDMEMHTAGSLKGGQLVWALARVKDGFFVGRKKDEVQSHLLFTNPHQFGKAIDIRFTPIRVVCWNTLSMAIGRGLTIDQQVVRSSHRKPFDAERVMATLGIAHTLLEEYRDAANFIAGKRFTDESLNEYFSEIFPKGDASKNPDVPHRNHQMALALINNQPGADLEEGSWWQALNVVTYMTDHVLGRSDETRLESAWFGSNRVLKNKALNLAVEKAAKSPDLITA
jgi:phage/plasmid-like protein (TIGR03299 family)